MNWLDKVEMLEKLRYNLACWMVNHGEETFRNEQSNEYVGVLIQEIVWRGKKYQIVVVDGIVCSIDKIKYIYTECQAVELIEKCVKDVIKDISDTFFEGRSMRTSEIIRDYKSEAYEHGISEEKFDRLYRYIMNEELHDSNAHA